MSNAAGLRRSVAQETTKSYVPLVGSHLNRAWQRKGLNQAPFSLRLHLLPSSGSLAGPPSQDTRERLLCIRPVTVFTAPDKGSSSFRGLQA